MRFRNVLVVDDSQDQADVLVALLRQEPGVVAVSCTNAATALDLLDQDWKIDLVVSDYMMPGIDGLELASEIRRARPEIPVVLVTGHDEAIDRIAAGSKSSQTCAARSQSSTSSVLKITCAALSPTSFRPAVTRRLKH